MEELNIKKIGLLVAGLLAVVVLLLVGRNILENNDAGHFQVKQGWLSGDLSVRNSPGVYWQGLGKITTYQMSPTLKFIGSYVGGKNVDGKDAGQVDADLGGTAYVDTPFAVTFMGNSTADVGGIIKVRMPVDEKKQLALHILYRNEASIVDTLVRQTVGEAVKLAGPMFTAEEARTTRREEYTSLVLDMIQNGLYQTYSTTETVKDEDGNIRNNAVTRLKKDSNGNYMVVKQSPIKAFGIEVVQFTIRGLDFDKVTQDLMMAKKQSEQEKIVARTRAQTAQQNAETAKQEGIAKVAEATAEENVKKTRQVVKAQADFESAQFARKQAEQEAAAKIAQGQAEAQVSRLKVGAGLTPFERADFDMKTKIGVAHELAQTTFPTSMIVSGGGKNGGAVNPIEALGMESLYNLSQKMAAQNPRVEKAPVAVSAPEEK